MKPVTIALLVFFGLVLVVDCFFILHDLQQNRIFSKTLLMPLLFMALYTATPGTAHKRSKIFLSAALIFCFAGDLLLLFQSDEIVFISGLCCFLVAHIFYILFFSRIKPFSRKTALLTFFSSIFIFGYMIFLLVAIWLEVSKQDMEIPVMVYAFAIGTMLLGAVNTASGRRLKKLAFIHFIPGALLFVISDSILALNKFSYPVVNADILIIITYAAAQFLIITGGIRMLKK